MGKRSALIHKAATGNFTPRELAEFVHICTSLAESYLRTQRYFNKLYSAASFPDKSSDLALDVIAPLFARDDFGCFLELQTYFKPLLWEIENDETLALVYLRRLVVSKAKQELIYVFKKEDPAGWRIYRNVQLAPKRNKRIATFRDFGRINYYYRSAAHRSSVPSGLRPELEEISANELEQKCLQALKSSNKTPEVVEHVLKSMTTTQEFRLFVSREKLFHALNSVWGLQFLSFSENSNVWEQNFDLNKNRFDQENFITDVTEYIRDAIQKKYKEKQKVTEAEAGAYTDILTAYFHDLLSQGFSQKIPKYMNNWSGNGLLSKNETKHRNRLEYMVKLGKKYLRNIWCERNFRI